jgi:hypothetical protein
MRRIMGIGAVLLGVLGVLICTAAIGLGWWLAARTVDRVEFAALRLDRSLSESDVRLARVESRVNAIRSELDDVRGEAEALFVENPELPRAKAAIERLLDRLVPILGQVDTTVDSLQAMGTGLRAAADIVDQFAGDPETTIHIRNAADMIDRSAETLNVPRAKVDAIKSAKATLLTRELVKLTREAIAGSDLLAEGVAAMRQQIPVARKWTAEYREKVVVRIYVAAGANMLAWSWGGLGQLCLIGWGLRRISNRTLAISRLEPPKEMSV